LCTDADVRACANLQSPLEEAKAADELVVSDIRKFQDYYQHHIKRKMEKAESHIKRFASTEAEVREYMRVSPLCCIRSADHFILLLQRHA
jgi:hypothetical protein